MTGKNCHMETFKNDARNKREELLMELEQKLEPQLYEKCVEHFKHQTYLLQSETKKEVDRYFDSLHTKSWAAILVLSGLAALGVGALVSAAGPVSGAVAAGAIAAKSAVAIAGGAAVEGAGVGAAVVAGGGAAVGAFASVQLATKQFYNSMMKKAGFGTEKLYEAEISNQKLTKYENGKIDLELCFGKVTIDLKSNKIN